jgi:hypothetical protein
LEAERNPRAAAHPDADVVADVTNEMLRCQLSGTRLPSLSTFVVVGALLVDFGHPLYALNWLWPNKSFGVGLQLIK